MLTRFAIRTVDWNDVLEVSSRRETVMLGVMAAQMIGSSAERKRGKSLTEEELSTPAGCQWVDMVERRLGASEAECDRLRKRVEHLEEENTRLRKNVNPLANGPEGPCTSSKGLIFQANIARSDGATLADIGRKLMEQFVHYYYCLEFEETASIGPASQVGVQ